MLTDEEKQEILNINCRGNMSYKSCCGVDEKENHAADCSKVINFNSESYKQEIKELKAVVKHLKDVIWYYSNYSFGLPAQDALKWLEEKNI